MSSGRLIDLRPGRAGKRVSEWQGVLPRIARVPVSPKRPAPLRARRRKVRAIAALVVVLLLAAVAWGVSWASYLPRLSIGAIEVVGAEKVPAELIRQYVDALLDDGSHQIISRRNIFVYPRAVLERAVQGDFPRIRSVTVSRAAVLATTVTVGVLEREPYALWCTDTAQCYALDDGGFIFAEYPGDGDVRLATPYIFYGGVDPAGNPIGQRFAPGHLASLAALLRLVGQAGYNPQAVKIQGGQDILITLGDGFTLKASFGQDANALVKNLQLILSSSPLQGKENQLEYLDLRFNNRVYYKLKGEAEINAGQ